MPPRTTKNSAGAAPENTEHAPMDVQLVPADAELDPANVEGDTSDVELALTEQFSDNRLEQFMSLSEKRRRKEEERREEREAKRHEEREQRRREYEARREEREAKRCEEREQERREYEERREEREEKRREERERERREYEDRREERRQEEHWHLLQAIQALSAHTPVSKPATIAPVVVEEDPEAEIGTAGDVRDPTKTASTAQPVKNEPFRGTRGGANRTQKTLDGANKQQSQGIHNSKDEAQVWKHTPYFPGAQPEPNEPTVRLVFPALSAFDHIPDSASFDVNKTTVAKVFGIPALSRITDPDLPKKLDSAQDVFSRNIIPTSLWAFYLASKMSGDFAPVAKKINLATKWHICVWSVVTCLEGLEHYMRTREALLRVSQAVPANFQAGIVELCARYKETPILMVSPSTRIDNLGMTVNTWGPAFDQEVFAQALKKSDYKLSTAGEYILTIDTIEAVLRKDLNRQIKQVTTLAKYPQSQSSPDTIMDSALYQVQAADIDDGNADHENADDVEVAREALYVAQYQKSSGKCFNCGKKGHFASTCKQPKKAQYSQRPSRATGSFAQRGGNTTSNTTRRQETRDGDKRPSVVAKSLASAKDGEFVRIEGRLYRKNTGRNQALVLEEGDDDDGDGDTEEFLEQEADEFDQSMLLFQ
ncbi:hypothetical protein SEPCBS119000_000866 [Sporothrix epigloea]|uniref:CCHC-type domain-containing protein n=1 Tax=Sporothrix epigloea TaxID=1892477 RepID=A0ABP0DA27_9PEZI